jgi:hypothetical protein
MIDGCPMSTDFVPGRITAFKREQGFGTITLDDGRQVPFDAGICQMAPSENDAVLVQVGKAKWGNKDKAVVVKPIDRTAPPFGVASAERPLGLEAFALGSNATPLARDQQIGLLQAQHLLGGLTEETLVLIEKDLPADAALVAVLDAYYEVDPTHAIDDGYVRIYDLAGAPAAFREILPALVVDGAESVEMLVAQLNAMLRVNRDGKRIHKLDTGAAWSAYYVLAHEQARALAKVLPFAAAPDTIP